MGSTDHPHLRQPLPLVEGEDYYLESGRWVFTERFHRRRGYCCRSACRHCPYRSPEAPTGDVETVDEPL